MRNGLPSAQSFFLVTLAAVEAFCTIFTFVLGLDSYRDTVPLWVLLSVVFFWFIIVGLILAICHHAYPEIFERCWRLALGTTVALLLLLPHLNETPSFFYWIPFCCTLGVLLAVWIHKPLSTSVETLELLSKNVGAAIQLALGQVIDAFKDLLNLRGAA